MSFLKIVDPAKREQTVKEFLAIKKNIRANELAEKTGKTELQRDLSELFKPVTKTQKDTQRAITEGLIPIKTGIEQLPQRLPKQRREFLQPLTILKERPSTPPPAYRSPQPSTSKAGPEEEVFPDSDFDFGIYEKGGEYFLGNKSVELIEDEKGERFIIISDDKTGEKKMHKLTEGLWELITSKKYDPKVKASDVSNYREILIDTNTMYVKNDPKSGKLKPPPKGMDKGKWKIISSNWEKLKIQEKLGKKGSGV